MDILEHCEGSNDSCHVLIVCGYRSLCFDFVLWIGLLCEEPMWSRLAVGPLGPMLLGAMAAMACGSALMLGTMGAQAQASNCEAVVMQFLLIISSYR